MVSQGAMEYECSLNSDSVRFFSKGNHFKESVTTRSKRASGGCLRLLVAMKDVASDETLWGPAGRG